MSASEKPPVGSIGWCDLTVGDAGAVRDFYRDVVGWTSTDIDMGGYADYCMNQPFNGTATTGVCWARGVNADLPPVWLVYFVVASLDTTHPLTVGMGEWIGVLKEGSRRLPVGPSGQVLARFDEGGHIGGLISDFNMGRIAGTPFATMHSMGAGNVICFSDDLTMRGFFIGPRRLLLNAILLGPSL